MDCFSSINTGLPISNDESMKTEQWRSLLDSAPFSSDEVLAPHQEIEADYRMGDKEDEVPLSFPQKLMEILGSDEAADIISWLPHGKGFLIYKKKKFATDILPKFFKQSKYTSFTRKLNRWGFIRVTRGPETGAYYHKLFQRGDFLLCMQMCCQTTKPTTSSLIFDDQLSINVSNDYSSQTHSAVDLVQQSQDMIRRQLQHLQFQQLQLQQLQFQQQQQLHAAELLRVQFANDDNEESLMDDPTQPTPLPTPEYLQMHQQQLNMDQHQMHHHQKQQFAQQYSKEDLMNSFYIQTLGGTKDFDNGMIDVEPVVLLPILDTHPFMVPSSMDQHDYRPTGSGNGRAWAA